MIHINSESKGSNPGGRCVVNTNGQSFNGYFKYCYGSKIQGTSSFKANHQAVYEALTFQSVRALGLETTDFYILLNKNKNTVLLDWKRFMKHDPSGREIYFISKILLAKEKCSDSIEQQILNQEKVYLDAILVADIIGKRQNYSYSQDQKSGKNKITYLDLGCSFVYAKDGYLSLPHKAAFYTPKDLRSAIRQLYSFVLLSKTEDQINLGEFMNALPKILLPTLNPEGYETLEKLITIDEIHEVQGYFAQGILRNIHSLKQRNLILK